MRAALLLLLPATGLSAQEFFLQPASFFVTPGERVKVIVSGVPPALVRDADMYTATGAYNMLNLRAEPDGAAVDVSVKGPGTPLLAVRTAPRVETLHPAQSQPHWLNIVGAPAEPPAGPIRERTTAFAKALLLSAATPDDTFRRRAGHALEIVPDRNPYTLGPGEPLPVHVFLHGKPAAALLVSAPGARPRPPVRTDSGGRATVSFAGPGVWQVHTSALERSPDTAAADWDRFLATLAFELK